MKHQPVGREDDFERIGAAVAMLPSYKAGTELLGGP